MKVFQLNHAVHRISTSLVDLEDIMTKMESGVEIEGETQVLVDMVCDEIVFWVNQLKVGVDGIKYVPEPYRDMILREKPKIFKHT